MMANQHLRFERGLQVEVRIACFSPMALTSLFEIGEGALAEAVAPLLEDEVAVAVAVAVAVVVLVDPSCYTHGWA